MSHLMFAELGGGLEAHVTLGAGVELVGRAGVGRRVALAFPGDASMQDGHVGYSRHALDSCGGHLRVVQTFAFLMDETVPRQTGAVVKLFTTDVTRVDPPLPMEPKVTAQHPAALETEATVGAGVGAVFMGRAFGGALVSCVALLMTVQ